MAKQYSGKHARRPWLSGTPAPGTNRLSPRLQRPDARWEIVRLKPWSPAWRRLVGMELGSWHRISSIRPSLHLVRHVDTGELKLVWLGMFRLPRYVSHVSPDDWFDEEKVDPALILGSGRLPKGRRTATMS